MLDILVDPLHGRSLQLGSFLVNEEAIIDGALYFDDKQTYPISSGILRLLATKDAKQRSGKWIGVDVSVSIDVAQERLGQFPNTQFVQADLLSSPFRKEMFDTVFSEGVLHHTADTELALKTLVPLIKPGGEMFFYVYRKKGPMREFADDYIRNKISSKTPEEKWRLLQPITHLAQSLAELNVEC